MEWKYWDPSRSEGVVFAFRGTRLQTKQSHRFVLAGLDAARLYELHFQDGSAPVAQATGNELMTRGLNISLPNPLSSELVFLSEISARH